LWNRSGDEGARSEKVFEPKDNEKTPFVTSVIRPAESFLLDLKRKSVTDFSFLISFENVS